MSIAALFALVAVGVAGWWLFARHLMAKPWEHAQSQTDNEHSGISIAVTPAKVGLWMLLAVITSFFGLLISAYGMRMELGDWRPLAVPELLWGNTAVLVLSSVAFQWTRVAAARGNANSVRFGLVASGLFAIAFLVGQLFAWQQLSASERFVAGDVANAFFYLLTGLHGLHLLGGLSVWSRTTARMWNTAARLSDIRPSIELCAVYWHFLLVVWIALFAIFLSGSTLRNIWLGICSAVGIPQ